jgi:hypothetical protein
LVEVVVLGDGLGLGGIEGRGLIEVAWEVLPGKVFGFGASEIELSLGLDGEDPFPLRQESLSRNPGKPGLG